MAGLPEGREGPREWTGLCGDGLAAVEAPAMSLGGLLGDSKSKLRRRT